MNIDYAKAYSNERLAHASRQRQRREAMRIYRETTRGNAGHSLRNTVGDHLISLGQRMSGTSAPLPLATRSR